MARRTGTSRADPICDNATGTRRDRPRAPAGARRDSAGHRRSTGRPGGRLPARPTRLQRLG
ncbi:hypothetical protein DLJ59_26005, partial [Micromonospora inaquosa]